MEPGVGRLGLGAAHDVLAEDAVVVADAVADPGDAERGHRVEETSRQPAEAAVSEPRVRLLREHLVEVDAEAVQGVAHRLEQAEVGEPVLEQAPEQELERQVIDDLRLLQLASVPGAGPAIEHAIARGARDTHEMVEPRGRARVLALTMLNVLHEALTQ